MSDDEILKWAVLERRIIITTDNDFEELIWRQGKPHCGVLRLYEVPGTVYLIISFGEQ